MSSQQNVLHSRLLAGGKSGELVRFSREEVRWEWMSMSPRWLNSGEIYATSTKDEEAAFVILGGKCTAKWDRREQSMVSAKMYSMVCLTAYTCQAATTSLSMPRPSAK